MLEHAPHRIVDAAGEQAHAVHPADPVEEHRAEGEVAAARGAAENYSKNIDEWADGITTTIAIIGAVVATVVTGGGAAPLVAAAIAGGFGLAGMAAKYAIKGGRYGWEEALTDLGMTGVQMVTAGLGQKLQAIAAASKTMGPLQQALLPAVVTGGLDSMGLGGGIAMALLGTLWIWMAGIILSEAIGRTNWSPLSGMTLVGITLLIVLTQAFGMGRDDSIIAALMVGAAMCVAMSQATDLMLDLKTGVDLKEIIRVVTVDKELHRSHRVVA